MQEKEALGCPQPWVPLHPSLECQWSTQPGLLTRRGTARDTPAEHELSPHCTPAPGPCERERRAGGGPRRALLPSHMAPRPPSNKAPTVAVHMRGWRVSEKKQRVWEETRLPALLHSTATSAGQRTSGEGFCPGKDHLEVHQGKKKRTDQGRKKTTHTHS